LGTHIESHAVKTQDECPEDIVEALSRLCSGAPGQRLVVERGSAWLVVSRTDDAEVLRIEAAAASDLPAGAGLDLNGVGRLRAEGFGKGTGAKRLERLHRGVEPSALESLSASFDRIFTEVYAAPRQELGLRLRPAPELRANNGPLLGAIREVAKDQAGVARNRLYQRLLDAELLLLMDGDKRPRKIEELCGFPVYAAFTDAETLWAYDPRSPACLAIPGRALFPMLMEHNVGSLMINRGGKLGGELYRNELEMLAQAVWRRHGGPALS
jgi:hypothetical protein